MAVLGGRSCVSCGKLTSANPRLCDCNCVRAWRTPDGKLASSAEFMAWFGTFRNVAYKLHPNGITWTQVKIWTVV